MTAALEIHSRREHRDNQIRTSIHGFPPVNPFEELRTQNDMTLGELSTYSHIDKRALQRSEFGLYNAPLPSLVTYWANRGEHTYNILSQYEDFQVRTRRFNSLLFGPSLSFDLDSETHPLRQLRSRRLLYLDVNPDSFYPCRVGLTEFCQLLCVPLDSIQFFEKKWRVQKSVPKVLKLALNQAGYSHVIISRFENDYQTWRQFNLYEGVKFS